MDWYLNEWTDLCMAKNSHLTSIDSVCTIFSCMVHSHHPVKHGFFFFIIGGRQYNICPYTGHNNWKSHKHAMVSEHHRKNIGVFTNKHAFCFNIQERWALKYMLYIYTSILNTHTHTHTHTHTDILNIQNIKLILLHLCLLFMYPDIHSYIYTFLYNNTMYTVFCTVVLV